MAKIIIDELITLIGFKTTKESKQAISGIENGIRTMRKMALVATGAMTGLAFAMDKIASGVDKQAKFARSIGISFENLQKLQFAGQKAGVSVSEMNGFLETLAKTMTSTIPGQYNAALAQLGISARDANGNVKDLIPTILEVSKKLAEQDPIKRLQFTARLGASSSLANLFGEGPKQISKAMSELDKIGGVIPERLTKQAAELVDDSLLRVKKTINGLVSVLTLSLTPAVSKLLDRFDMWLVANQKIIAVNLGRFIKAVSRGFSEFGDTISSIASTLDSFSKKIFENETSLKGLNAVTFLTKAALLALSAAILGSIAPFIALGATIEVFLGKIPDLIETLKAAATLFFALLPQSLDKTKGSINEVSDSLERLLGLFSKLKDVKDFLKGVSEKLGAPLTLFNLKDATKGLKGATALLNIGKGGGKAAVQKIVAQSESAGSIQVPLRGGAANQNTTNNVNISVNGAGSPTEVAKKVKEQIDLSTAVQTASPGFNRSKVA